MKPTPALIALIALLPFMGRDTFGQQPGGAAPATWHSLLSPSYSALLESTEKPQELVSAATEVPRMRELITPLGASPQRDLALYLCIVIERASPIAREYITSQNPGVSTAAGAAQRDAFFKSGALNRYRTAMQPFVAAGKAAWDRLGNAAAPAAVARFVTEREQKAATRTFGLFVQRSVPGGAIATVSKSSLIANGLGIVGGANLEIFVKGLTGVVDDEYLTAKVYRDGAYAYTDAHGDRVTIQQWVLVSLEAKAGAK